MNPRHRLQSAATPALLVLLALQAPPAAQDAQVGRRVDGAPAVRAAAPPVAAGPGPARAPLAGRAAWSLQRVDGDPWYFGAALKARFDRGGAHFTPPLGADAPRSLPLTLSLAAVDRGGASLRVGAPVAPEIDGGAVRYRRGDGVTEVYAARADGIELSFELERLPAGAGDLVVRMRVAGELVAVADGEPAAGVEGADGARFRAAGAPDAGGLRIGGVVGIDADGRRARGSLRLAAGRLELVLPAAFVDSAALPLVVDPLVSGEFGVPSGGLPQANPDAAYEPASDRWLVAWEARWSGTDVDLYAQRLDADGAPVGGLIVLEPAFEPVSVAPSVTSAPFSGRFVVAWREGGSLLDEYELRVAWIDPATGLFGAVTLDAETDLPVEHDLGSAGYFSDDVIVVYRELGEERLEGRRVDVSLGGVPVADPGAFVIADGAANVRPRIAESGRASGLSYVVWQRLYQDSSTDHDVHGAVVTAAGLDSPFQAIRTTIGPNEELPVVDGDGGRWIVAWQREAFLGAGGADVEAVGLTYQAPGVSPAVDPVVHAFSDTPGLLERGPSVAVSLHRTFLAWSAEQSFLDFDVRAVGIDRDTLAVCEPELLLAGGAGAQTQVRLTAQRSATEQTLDRVLAVWQETGLLPPFDPAVEGAFLEDVGPGGPWANLGGGCGAGGKIAAVGPIAVGNPDFVLELTDAAPGATLALLSVGASNPLACGTCTLNLPGLLFAEALVGGAAQKALPIPCQPSLAGGTVIAQWAVLPTPGGCPLFGDVAASDRLSLTVGY